MEGRPNALAELEAILDEGALGCTLKRMFTSTRSLVSMAW